MSCADDPKPKLLLTHFNTAGFPVCFINHYEREKNEPVRIEVDYNFNLNWIFCCFKGSSGFLLRELSRSWPPYNLNQKKRTLPLQNELDSLEETVLVLYQCKSFNSTLSSDFMGEICQALR